MDNTFYIRFSDPTAFSAKARENLRDLYIVKGTWPVFTLDSVLNVQNAETSSIEKIRDIVASIFTTSVVKSSTGTYTAEEQLELMSGGGDIPSPSWRRWYQMFSTKEREWSMPSRSSLQSSLLWRCNVGRKTTPRQIVGMGKTDPWIWQFSLITPCPHLSRLIHLHCVGILLWPL